jgi:hypothetical protein
MRLFVYLGTGTWRVSLVPFRRDQPTSFRIRDLPAFTYQLSEPRYTPHVSFSAFALAGFERPSRSTSTALREATAIHCGFADTIVPYQASTHIGPHSRMDHRRLELGLDLLSLIGNPRRFMKVLVREPGSQNGLTYLVFNGSR